MLVTIKQEACFHDGIDVICIKLLDFHGFHLWFLVALNPWNFQWNFRSPELRKIVWNHHQRYKYHIRHRIHHSFTICLVVWNHGSLWLSIQLGMSSSQPGWCFQTFFIFHFIWVVVLPIDELIFFKMVKTTTNQQLVRTPSFFRGVGIPPTSHGRSQLSIHRCHWIHQSTKDTASFWHALLASDDSWWAFGRFMFSGFKHKNHVERCWTYGLEILGITKLRYLTKEQHDLWVDTPNLR